MKADLFKIHMNRHSLVIAVGMASKMPISVFSRLEIDRFQNLDDRSAENDSPKTHQTLRFPNLS